MRKKNDQNFQIGKLLQTLYPNVRSEKQYSFYGSGLKRITINGRGQILEQNKTSFKDVYERETSHPHQNLTVSILGNLPLMILINLAFMLLYCSRLHCTVI